MFEASYGYPSDNPDDIVWITLPELVELQGPDPKKWTIKPYCPHCKTVLRGYDKKAGLGENEEGNLGYYVISQENTDPDYNPRRPVVGFSHRAKEAKPDCPYSYANSPAFRYRQSRGTFDLERQRNLAKLRHPATAEAIQEILEGDVVHWCC